MTRDESIVGLHDLPVDEYHRDELTSEPALSASGIRTLLNATPAHFKARNPRLTDWPERIEEPTKAQDLGTVVHKLILGKGHEFEVADETITDFRTKAAQQWRDQVRLAGQIPILKTTYRDALQISNAATKALTERFGGWPIGESEVTGIWQRETPYGPIWCRMLMDHWSRKACTILDIKTTSKGISDDELRKKIANDGGDIQAAWYASGAETIFPELAGLVQFKFIFVEVEPPLCVRPIGLSESWLTRARFRIDRAANDFAKCLKSGEFPGYPAAETQLSAPTYLETKWEAEELESA